MENIALVKKLQVKRYVTVRHVDLVNLDKVPTRDLTKGNKSGVSEANCDHSEGITVRAFKTELA